MIMVGLRGSTIFYFWRSKVARTQTNGKQIKDESIETQDIKNGTILLEDLNQEVIDLLGQNGATTLAALLDVLIPNPIDGQQLTFNVISGKWEGVVGTSVGSGSGVINEFIYRDTNLGNLSYSLPEASTVDGQIYTVKKFDANYKLTVDVTGGGLIDDSTSFILRTFESLIVKSYNNQWYII